MHIRIHQFARIHLCLVYADAARAYFKHQRVFRYHMKKISDMADDEVVQKCHLWQEANGMVKNYWQFVKENFPELA